ncbi:MAG TPA: error-prone DNA polymerase [Bryobacterales bacterium]|nr:error-prone DNA polymerase [Bryobacterales bacterium]
MYVELHARSAFSFLEGASLPEDLVTRAADLDIPAFALLDRDGVYGAPRFHQAAKKAGLRTHIGAEITAAGTPPGGPRYVLLVESRQGYQNLCRLLTRTHLRAKKGEAAATPADLAEHAQGLICLWDGCRPVEPLLEIFGSRNVYAELQRHFDRAEEARNQYVIETARRFQLPLLATGGVAYAEPADRELLDVLTCIRHKVRLETAGRLLAPNSERYLKSPAEMQRLFADLPEALANTLDLSARLQFTLADLGYQFPEYPTPPGETMNSFLRQRTEEGARRRYRPYHDRARRQIERELALIEKLSLAGYFLIVWDIVQFCRRSGILVQGRGSAANSAVCYSLGITAVDPVGMDLLFERFLSEERGEWPDIDIDLPSGDQRERVIQYVYQRYGERGAAMTANVITYRGRSAAREVGKVLGFDEAAISHLSSLAGTWEWRDPDDSAERHFRDAGLDLSSPRIRKFLELYQAIQDLPRHLGQHSGGMVVCQGRLDSVVPLEPAAMPGRVVVQWDKEDCADMGIIKVDLLGLGMMAAIEETLALIRDAWHEEVDLAHLPPNNPLVYAALQHADTIGMFQVESRAQMSSLPRLRPKTFYDIVVQVAIIRPGPIVGKMVNPYIKRRQGREPVDYPHPSLEPVLKRTLGVPLFQEQLLRIAMIAAGFSGGEAEELRRAFGFKRSERRMKEIEVKLRRGMDRNGITGQAQDRIVQSIASFALYGFPESHAASFALLAYASAYLKCHYLAAFTAALLNNQPMGFYHPATIIKDAQRHGLRVKPIDVTRSGWLCTIEDDSHSDKRVRLGLRYVKGLRQQAAEAIVRERSIRSFTNIDDLARRVPELHKDEIRTLAEIGALNSLGAGHRRDALWQAERAGRPTGPLLEELPESAPASPLPPMSPDERLLADFRSTSVTLGPHPMAYRRAELAQYGVLRAIDLHKTPHGRAVRIAGCVIARQRPGTAKGFLFLSLEDETGIANAIVTPDLFDARRAVLVDEPFLIIDGILQNQDTVISVKATRVQPLLATACAESHDFH